MGEKNLGAKKRTTILVVIALILAIVAISFNVMDSEEIPTTRESKTTEDAGGSNVGVDIIPASVEDKLNGEQQS